MEMNNLIKEEIQRYLEIMNKPSGLVNEAIIPVNAAAKGLARFTRGAAKNTFDTIVTKEIKTAINKTFKNTTSAFFDEITRGVKKIDIDLLAKTKPQEVADKISKSLRRQGYTLTQLEEVALRREVSKSLKATLSDPAQKLRMYKKSFNRPQLDEFNRLKGGRNLSNDELLKLARKAKKFKSVNVGGTGGKTVTGGGNKTVIGGGGKKIINRFKKFNKNVKGAWEKIKIRWNSLSRAQRRFWRVTGVLLGVGLATWLYFVLSKEGYCKCLLNMMQDSDADYMDRVSMEDAMFLGTTGNAEIDAQGGGIFYLEGDFKSKNGRLQGTYTCNNSGVFIEMGGQEYKLECLGGVDDQLPIEEIEDGDNDGKLITTGGTEDIQYKDCDGPEYRLGCTDQGDTIERVQSCLGLTVTGKFDKELEMALLKKLGKKTFTDQDVFIICDLKSKTKFTFG